MKYCVSNRQPYSVMKNAQEIFVQYRDRDQIMDFVEKIPDKTIILDYPEGTNAFEWATWSMYREKFEKFYIALHNLTLAEAFNEQGIEWYWPFPITSFYELRAVAAAGAGYVVLGAPLTHSLDKVKSVLPESVKVRMVANQARPEYLAAADPITGSWIRPEDVKLYEDTVDALEFKSNSLKEESALLHIYAENGEWPGNLNLIVHDLNKNLDNRGVFEDFGTMRTNCGQKCMSGSSCSYCFRALEFSNVLKNYAKSRQIDNE